MNINTAESTATSPRLSPLSMWWRLPSVTVARFTLTSYVRRGWILGDVIFVWFLYALFFLESSGDVAYFYGTGGQGLDVLAILSTIVIVQWSLNARVYARLARLISRAAYVRGLVLATAILRVPSFILLLVLELGYHEYTPLGIKGATIGNMIPGALGAVANTVVLATVLVTFSAPIATRLAHIGLFAWLAAVLFSNSSPTVFAQALAFTRIPLIPISICYELGRTQTLDWTGIVGLVGDALLVFFLIKLAEHWMRRRDLILQ